MRPMSPIDIFPWNEDFNTGIANIDEQHKHLVDLLNQLASHVALKAEFPELNTIFGQLADYTIYHFQTEEEIWHRHLPDDALDKTHHENHELFIDDILKLKQSMNDRPIDEVASEVLSYLTRWLALHILDSDRYMARVVLAKQSGLSLEAAKRQADEQMKSSTRALLNVILSGYEALSSNALYLMRETGKQKRLEKSLADSEKKLDRELRQTANSLLRAQKIAQIGNFSYRIADGAIQWSPQLYAIFGRDPEKGPLDYDAVLLWIHPDDRKLHQQYMQEMRSITAATEAQIGGLHYRLIRPDGEIRWVEVTFEFEFNSADEAIVFFGTVQDVTERKQAEQALASSETRYRHFIENTMEGIFSIEPLQPIATSLPLEQQIELVYQGRIVSCNDAKAQLYGYTRASELIGKTLKDLHASSNDPENIAFLRQWIEADYRISDMISQGVDRSGQPKWFSNSVVGVVEDGYLISVWGSQTDISQRMQAEQRLEHNEAQLRLITSIVPFAIALLDINRRYKFCNESYAQIFGMQPEELIGRHARNILGATAYTTASAYMDRVLKGEACGYGLILSNTPHGRREVDVRYVPELGADDVVKGFIATITDITEQKQLERQQLVRSGIHRLLAFDLPLKALLENIVLSVEDVYPDLLCSIMLLDQQGEHLYKAAAPSLPDFYSEAIEGMKVGVGIGSCGTAAYTGKRVIVDDISTHPFWAAYRDLAESAGLRSCWSQPILSPEGRVLGTFAIYRR